MPPAGHRRAWSRDCPMGRQRRSGAAGHLGWRPTPRHSDVDSRSDRPVLHDVGQPLQRDLVALGPASAVVARVLGVDVGHAGLGQVVAQQTVAPVEVAVVLLTGVQEDAAKLLEVVDAVSPVDHRGGSITAARPSLSRTRATNASRDRARESSRLLRRRRRVGRPHLGEFLRVGRRPSPGSGSGPPYGTGEFRRSVQPSCCLGPAPATGPQRIGSRSWTRRLLA